MGVFIHGSAKNTLCHSPLTALAVGCCPIRPHHSLPMSPLQLEFSIPFVTFPWRTSVFSIHNRETPRTATFKQEIENKLQEVTLPGRTMVVILNMANSIDVFEQELKKPARKDIVTFLGLGDIKPQSPNDKPLGALSGKLANVFLCAVIIDRFLWALSINIVEPFIRYINDDFPAELEHLDMKRFKQPMDDVAASFAVCGDREVEYSATLPGDNLRCGIATLKHAGLARIHNVASHLYYTASLILFLGIVGEMYYIQSAQLTTVTQPEDSRQQLKEEFMSVLAFIPVLV